MTENARITAQRELIELLATCQNSSKGCFRDDPEALLGVVYFDDSWVRAELSSIAIGADKASTEGVSIEDATYMPMKLVVNSGIGKIVQEGMSKPIPHDGSEVSPNSVDELRVNVANCAFVCGQAAEVCPLKTEQQ